MRKVLEQCPSCGGEMIVTEMSCTQCETVVRGKFHPGPFYQLPEDKMRFLEVFVMVRGNVKEMERELGINYWTIRNRLAEIVRLLGYEADPELEEKLQQQKKDILKSLERGEITVDEAQNALEGLRLSGLLD